MLGVVQCCVHVHASYLASDILYVDGEFFTGKIFVSGFEQRGHLGRDLNFEILIYSQSIENQLSFNACFTFIAAWVTFYAHLYKLLWPTAKPRKSFLKTSEHIHV